MARCLKSGSRQPPVHGWDSIINLNYSVLNLSTLKHVTCYRTMTKASCVGSTKSLPALDGRLAGKQSELCTQNLNSLVLSRE